MPSFFTRMTISRSLQGLPARRRLAKTALRLQLLVLGALHFLPVPLGGVAYAQALIVLSGAGLGEAKFGMAPAAVERAIGRKLTFEKDDNCTNYMHARAAGLPGTMLVFARNGGRFVAVDVDQPTVVTPSGFKVGGAERAVIEKYKADKTYHRNPNRHDDNKMEIVIGNAQFVRTPQGQGWQGTAAKFESVRGVIKGMQVGEAAVVLDDEYCA